MRLPRPSALFAFALAALCAAGEAWAADGSGARLGLHGEGVTRFVADLTDTVSFKAIPKADPYRMVIDAPGLNWVGGGLSKPWGAVNGMRIEDGRVVLDLRKPALAKSAFIIPPRDGMGWRLVVDLAETSRESFLSAAGAAAGAAPPVALKPLPPAAKPVPVRAEPALPPVNLTPPPSMAATPEPAPEPAPVVSRPPDKIVMTSPNAQAAPVVEAQPLPEPVTAPVAVAPVPSPVPSPVSAPAPVKPRGQPTLSAPMPPPPERPAPAAAPAPVAQPAPQPTPAPVVQAAQPAPNPPTPIRAAGHAKARDGVPVIVIDPGHGGVDPGATGVSGIYEKHITLAMARELKAVLEKNGRYRVHLTRDRDVFIRLRERVAIARAQGADLFISLHADAVQNPLIRGLSVYTLSQNASDSEAQALAEKENKADLIAGVDLTHESPDVAGILIDLAQRETMNRSAGFAAEVVDEVGQEMDLLGNTHRFAGFAVLKAPDVPAILVEMGYLSNEYEEKQLRQPQYRAKLAKAMATAVERYFPSSLKAKRP